ncbi:PLP-dependent aminotransferase family protein [bacterium]|nr:PLP-dependent aminotransferase family protein [bacterium]MCB1220057.1 PLP-dependent aminotransferase family protein [bacterium]UNM07719.1 MAG: PLP-dependent aminotransferase family protein [Planctomycetales bacterium]
MNLSIDKDSREPVYEQIRRQVTELVNDGLLAAGQKIPSVRDLAKQLGVSVKTVYSAYEALAAEKIIETRHGSGTYITEHPDVVTGANLRTREEMGGRLEEIPPMRWEPYFLQSGFFGMPPYRDKSQKLIRMSLGSPDPGLFPFDKIKQVATTMLWYPKEYFFDRGNPQGFHPLIEYLEKEMALEGVPMAEGENDIILTGGFQRALTLVLDRILKPGQMVAIESPTFSGIMNLLMSREIGYVSIPMDKNGMDTDYLAGVLNQGEVRAIITIPTYHNPTGITMSKARREHLLRLAARHRIPIIEDDWGRQLRYEGKATPPLKAMDTGGYVIHIGTFSKCFLPGLRIGWITCPAPLSVSMVLTKHGSDAGDSFFNQALLHEIILKGHFSRHLRKTIREYKRRRDAMCAALSKNLPEGCSFHKPSGGFYVWVELPNNIKSLPLLTFARNAGVEFLPSSYCMPDRKDGPALRLSFSRTSVEEIEEGVGTLCRVIQDCIDNPDMLSSGAHSYEDLYK